MPAADLLRLTSSLSTTVHASDETPRVVRIDLLAVPEELRGRGCAKDALAQITQWADETSTVIALTATSAFGANISRLVGLYMQYGFMPTQRTAPTEVRMRRRPRGLTPAILPVKPLADPPGPRRKRELALV